MSMPVPERMAQPFLGAGPALGFAAPVAMMCGELRPTWASVSVRIFTTDYILFPWRGLGRPAGRPASRKRDRTLPSPSRPKGAARGVRAMEEEKAEPHCDEVRAGGAA